MRFTGKSGRTWRLALAVATALVTIGAGPTLAPSEARAEAEEEDLAVGVRLRALADVQLHKASIVKGSKVHVTRLLHRGGRLASVDLELADGHVVPKVAIATVRSFFRVADE